MDYLAYHDRRGHPWVLYAMRTGEGPYTEYRAVYQPTGYRLIHRVDDAAPQEKRDRAWSTLHAQIEAMTPEEMA